MALSSLTSHLAQAPTGRRRSFLFHLGPGALGSTSQRLDPAINTSRSELLPVRLSSFAAGQKFASMEDSSVRPREKRSMMCNAQGHLLLGPAC